MSTFEIIAYSIFFWFIISYLFTVIKHIRLISQELRRFKSVSQAKFPIIWLFSLAYLSIIGPIIGFSIFYFLYWFFSSTNTDWENYTATGNFLDQIRDYHVLSAGAISAFHLSFLFIYFLPSIMNLKFDRSIIKSFEKNFHKGNLWVCFISFIPSLLLFAFSFSGISSTSKSSFELPKYVFRNIGLCAVLQENGRILWDSHVHAAYHKTPPIDDLNRFIESLYDLTSVQIAFISEGRALGKKLVSNDFHDIIEKQCQNRQAGLDFALCEKPINFTGISIECVDAAVELQQMFCSADLLGRRTCDIQHWYIDHHQNTKFLPGNRDSSNINR
jgi:hypothetical protein